MKYLTVFLVIVLLQLTLINETKAQRNQRSSNRAGNSQASALTNLDLSSEIGYKKFWDKKSDGFFVYLDGEVIFYLNSSVGLGGFLYVAGGGGQFKDGSYREPSFNLQTGTEVKIRAKSSSYAAKIGYGQISRYGEVSSGLKDVIFGNFLLFGLEYQAYGRRLARQAWLPATKIYVEGKMALKKDVPVWSEIYSINYDLVPEMIKGTGEVAVVDVRIKDFTVSWGLNGDINIYDFSKLKVFYGLGSSLNFSAANNNIAKIYFGYQNGISGIKDIGRVMVGVSLDASFLFKINQDNSTQQNNNKRRSR